jgi:filamentous hemagglutinin family protein
MRPQKLLAAAAGRVLTTALATALVLSAAAFAPAEARAEAGPIVFDGTIGNVSPNDEPLVAPPNYFITDEFGAFSEGKRNLFFSFDRFGVPAGSSAFFIDRSFSGALQAVIARVTGGDPSEIFGGVNSLVPDADFFLLNPQGIFVGPDASFNVGGSIYLASADRLHWGPDGAEYFSTQPGDDASVMLDTDPIAFGFLSEAPAPVGIYGAQLSLTGETTFGVAGGVVEVVGTQLTKQSGLVELAAVRGNPGELLLPLDFAELDASGQALGPVRLGFSELGSAELPQAVALILADAPSTLDVSANTIDPRAPGAVVIRGDHFVMRGGEIVSEAAATNPVPVVADYAVDVEVDGELALEAGAEMRVENVSGTEEGGAIRLDAASVRVEGDSQVAAQNTGGAAGGEIQVRAVQGVSVRDGGQIFNQAVEGASARGGGVNVVASAADGRILVEGARPAGLGEEEPRISQISALSRTTDPDGDGGSLLLAAQRVEVRDGGQVRTSTLGAGDAGELQVTAGQLVVSGTADVGESLPVRSGLFALTRNTGAGGKLGIGADEVSIENGARVSASSQPSGPNDNLVSGPAGNLEITARRVTVRGGPDGASVVLAEAQAEGRAGDLVVRADELELVDGGALSALTTSTGDAGDIDVAARRILISGAEETGMFAQNSGGGNAGDAGSVSVDVGDSLRIENGGEISVTSTEFGVAGDVRIFGGGDVELSDGASIRATLAGDLRDPVTPEEDLRADVRIEDVRSLSLSDATITTETFESGDGGDVLVRTSGPVTLDHGSTITAQSTSMEVDAGNAGSIEIDAGTTLALVRGSRLETSAEAGSGGVIRLDAGELVYLSDAQVATNVVEPPPPPPGAEPEAAGDVVLALPTLAVLNRSSIVARARGEGNAGNILIATSGGFFPSDPLSSDIDAAPAGASVLDATAGPAGIAGTIEIVSPTADLVSQVTPLPVEFFDASRLLTTPCEARRARRGSLTVQTRRALEPPPDALFGADSVPDTAPAGECPTT